MTFYGVPFPMAMEPDAITCDVFPSKDVECLGLCHEVAGSAQVSRHRSSVGSRVSSGVGVSAPGSMT